MFLPGKIAFAQGIPNKIEIVVTDGDPETPPKEPWEITQNQVIPWLTPGAAAGTFLIAAYGAGTALREYKLKLKAEKRLAITTDRELRLKVQAESRQQESSQAEIDINVVKEFASLITVINASGDPFFSESIANKVFDILYKPNSNQELPDPYKTSEEVAKASVFYKSPTSAERTAYLIMISNLASRYEILKEPTRKMFQVLQKEYNHEAFKEELAVIKQFLETSA